VNKIQEKVIFESSHISEVIPHLLQGTLLVLDIDDTIITSSTYIGSISWVHDLIRKFILNGYSRQEAGYKAYILWRDAQKKTNAILTEKDASLLFENPCDCIGCTARSPEVFSITMQQLGGVGISFDNDSLSCTAENYCLSMFAKGIIFCGGQSKGGALFEFLHASSSYTMPDRIVMVDDTLEQLEDVGVFCESNEIDFFGFHYRRCNNQFPLGDTSNLSDIQQKALEVIYKKLKDSTIEWYVTGKTNIALHGLPVKPRGIDVVIHNSDLDRFLELFKDCIRSGIVILNNGEAQECSLSICDVEVIVCAEYDHGIRWRAFNGADILATDAMAIPCFALKAECQLESEMAVLK